MKYVIDFKQVDMIEEEHQYYQQLVKEFSFGQINGKMYFHDVFDVDEDGCISIIRPPLKTEIPWAIILFLQNTMLNQRIRRMEKWVQEKVVQNV